MRLSDCAKLMSFLYFSGKTLNNGAIDSGFSRDFRKIRGGRITKSKGQTVSYAPHIVDVVALVGAVFLRKTLPVALVSSFIVGSAVADTVYWDVNRGNPGQGGTGVWNLTNSYWNTSSDGVSGPFQAWSNSASDTAVFGGTAGTVTVGSGVTVGALNFTTNGYVLSGGTLTLAGAAPTITTSASSVSTTINSALAGTSGLTTGGAGTVYLAGNNTFSGGINLSSGTLRLNGDAAFGASGNIVRVSGSSTLTVDGSNTQNRTVSVDAGQTVNLTGTGSGAVFYTGAGNVATNHMVRLTNDTNNYTGTTRFNGSNGGTAAIYFSSVRNLGEASSLGAPTTVENGTITFAGGSQYSDRILYTGTGDSTNRNWVMGGSTLRRFANSGTGVLTITGGITLNRETTFESGTQGFNLLGVIDGSAALNLSATSTGSIRLGGANTYAGATAISGGLVVASTLRNAGLASSFGQNASISLNNGAIVEYAGSGDTTDRTWALSGNTSIRNDGTGGVSLTGGLAFNASNSVFTFDGSYSGVNTVSGTISGSGDLVSNGSGTWVLNGANTNTSNVRIDGGTLRLGNALGLGTVKSLAISGGALDLNGNDLSSGTLSGTAGTIALGSGTLTTTSTTASIFAGSITGGGGLTKLGTGALTLSGQSTYTGATAIKGSTLILDFSATGAPLANILSTSTSVALESATLKIKGGSQSNSQTFTSTEIIKGSNTIQASSGTGGTMMVNLGAINYQAGVVNFLLPTSGSIKTTNADGALGGWAMINNTDYAKVVNGVIVPFDQTDYTQQDNAALWLNDQIVSDTGGNPNTPFYGTVGSSITLGGLQYTAAAASTVTVANGQMLGIDGSIIVGPSVGNNAVRITGGQVTSGATGVVGVQQNSTGTFTIQSQIVDNGNPVDFNKSGTGRVTLAGSNTYTGVTTVGAGTLSVASIGNGGVASAIGASSADASNLRIQNATLEYTGNTAQTNRGMTLVEEGGYASSISVTQAAANLTVSGLVTGEGNGSLNKIGAGTLTLSGTQNDYVGPTVITAGTLAVTTIKNGGEVSSIGTSGSDAANLVLAGGTLDYEGVTATTDRGFTLSSNSGIAVSDSNSTLTMSGNVTGSGRLTKTGDGTLVLAGANNATGGNIVNAGILRAGAVNAFGPGNLVVNGGTADLAGYDNTVANLSGAGSVTLGSATLTVSTGGTFTGAISGTGSLRANGNTLTLTGCNSNYTGATNIVGGSISTNCLKDGGQVSGIGASSAASANLSLNNGTLIYSGDSISIDRGMTLAGSNNFLNVSNALSTLEMKGAFTGTGILRKQGTGTLILSGNNQYSGGTVALGGILQAGSTTAFGTGGLYMNAAGATVDLNNLNNSVAFIAEATAGSAGNIKLGTATLTITNGSNQSYSGIISGTGGLSKQGTGTQTLTGLSSYTGSTVVNGGTLAVNSFKNGGVNSAVGSSSSQASNLVLNGGTLSYVGTGDTTDRRFTLAGSSTLAASGSGALTLSNTNAVAFGSSGTASTLTLSGTNINQNILAARIDDNGMAKTSLYKDGSGVWAVTNTSSSYTGTTIIDEGKLLVTKLSDGGVTSSIGSASSDASNLVIHDGGTLAYGGSGDTTNRGFSLGQGITFIESSGTGAVSFTNNAPITMLDAGQTHTFVLKGTNSGNNTIAAAIGDAGAGATRLIKNDVGTWVLTGNNTYSGVTTINDGNLVVGDGGTSGSLGHEAITVTLATSTLSVNRSDGVTISGALHGDGQLAQIGTGKTILTSNANFIGNTIISSGELQVDGVLDTDSFSLSGTSTLTVNGTVESRSGGSTAVSSTGGNSTINVGQGGILRASGDLGTGRNTVTLSGTLDTGTGTTLTLGANNDRLVLNDGYNVTGGGVDAGTGDHDVLEVNTVLGQTLEGSKFTSFEDLQKNGAGTLTLTGTHTYADGVSVNAGILQIGTGTTATALNGNIANSTTVDFALNSDFSYSGIISGSGLVQKTGTGTTTLSGSNSYSGVTDIASGTLLIDGDQSGAVGLTTVYDNATIGGHGIVGGDVVILDGGSLNPGLSNGETNNFTINGNLTLNHGSIVNYSLGDKDAVGGPLNNLTDVKGNLVLDGNLLVSQTPGGSFGFGVYRLFDYGGTLTNNGLETGNSDYLIQTSVDHQINLVNSVGLKLSFWDGDIGPHADGTVHGGDGTWRAAGDTNWTDDSGQFSAPFDNGSAAIFQGTAGTVIVDNTVGQVEISGIQFAVDGYVIEGDSIALGGVSNILRVGDGINAHPAYTATINSVISGTGSIEKTDFGTLILGGANTYSGGTTISSGTLAISDDDNLGAAAGGMTLNGGTLQVTATTSSARNTVISANGGIIDTVADYTLAGVVSGAGTLTKTGSQTLILGGPNTYLGGTVINAGAVAVSADSNLGAAAGNVVLNGGTLQSTGVFTSARSVVLNAGGGTLNTDADLTWSGVISGAGALTKSGPAGLILIGTNSYTGGTTVSAGRLQIGNGGTSGSISGNVTNNGVFAFERSNNLTFDGLISGSGSFEQSGAGDVVLTADNSYAGATDVLSGSLYVNGNQTLATGDTNIRSGATLGGTGTVGGDVYIEANAILAPGSAGDAPGTLTINGNLVINDAAELNYRFGQHDVVGGPMNDLTIVHGDLTLGGDIHVTQSVGGDFGAGTYRVISYDGNLNDNTLNTSSPNYIIQTAEQGAVNLVRGADGGRNFWDGGNTSNVNNNIIDGGDGVWSLEPANSNWTDTTGQFNGGFSSGENAFFGGTAGVVTVDESAGAIIVGDMQFSVNGYRVQGDKIELGNAETNLRVGDGTGLGAVYTTTISSVLTGNSTLVKNDLGTLILDGQNTYTGGTIIKHGTLQISSDQNLGEAQTALTFHGGALANSAAMTSDRQVHLAGNGGFRTDENLTLQGVIDGTGALNKTGAGDLIVTGANSYQGNTTVFSGRLFVNGDQSAASGSLLVGNGGTLGGTGTIGGDIAIADGGTLMAGRGDQVGTLTIGGSLTLNTGSILNYRLGSSGDVGGSQNDLVNVDGNLTLAGTLNVSVSNGGTFGAGVYRLINYGGTLDDNGLNIGAMPTGDVFVQTSVDHQVNLVSTNGLTLNYWNGGAQGREANKINGGSGVWQAHYGNDNWTDDHALVNASYTDGSYAVFEGRAGTVTVDNSIGQVQVSGMQLATDGYLINGERIQLLGNPTIRVGDGTASGASMTGEIASQLYGDAHLVKDDYGTLILSGENAYKGGTQIKNGTLAVSQDSNLGDVSGNVSLFGGTLEARSSFESNRTLKVVSSSNVSVDKGASLVWSGTISGSGDLTKIGLGTFALKSGNETFTGNTWIKQGTLEVDSALCGDVNVNAGGRLQGTGSVCNINNFDGGVVGPGNSIGTLTVTGNYVGIGGTVEIETVLGGDNSATDVLKVAGNTSGNSKVKVINIGGAGDQTVNGIKIIDVAGASNGDFKLDGDYVFQGNQAVIGGAYAYRLYKNGVDNPDDGDWYLRSALANPNTPSDPTQPLYAPSVPLYEAYGQVLQRFNALGTYQQRTANRRWTDGMGGTQSTRKDDRQDSSAIWARIEASHTEYSAYDSTTGTKHDDTIWRVQSGVDGLLYENADGAIVGSVIANFGTISSDVTSVFGSGTIDTTGVGIGATATWYNDNGLYVDAQTGINWYITDMSSSTTGTSLIQNNNGYGLAASLEVGKNIAIDEHWSITPQAQLSYSNVDFNSFVDRYGSNVSLQRSNNLVGRLGVSAAYSDHWADQMGRSVKSNIYATGNLYYDFVGGSRVWVSDVAFANSNAPLWAGISLGGSLSWADGQYSLYGEVLTQTSVEDVWKSNSLGVKTGFSVRW